MCTKAHIEAPKQRQKQPHLSSSYLGAFTTFICAPWEILPSSCQKKGQTSEKKKDSLLTLHTVHLPGQRTYPTNHTRNPQLTDQCTSQVLLLFTQSLASRLKDETINLFMTFKMLHLLCHHIHIWWLSVWGRKIRALPLSRRKERKFQEWAGIHNNQYSKLQISEKRHILYCFHHASMN